MKHPGNPNNLNPTPANTGPIARARVKTNPGAVAINPSTPSQRGEFESCRTSQPWATACIQVPVFERKAPVQNKRKLRVAQRAKHLAHAAFTPELKWLSGRHE